MQMREVELCPLLKYKHELPQLTANTKFIYIPEKLPASIDGMLGLIVQAPVLPNQIRFRHV